MSLFKFEKRLFNQYCADVTNTDVYPYLPAYEDTEQLYIEGGSVRWHPHDNIEQLVDVVHKLTIKWLCSPFKLGSPEAMAAAQILEAHDYMTSRMRSGADIKGEFRGFVWNVMGTYSK